MVKYAVFSLVVLAAALGLSCSAADSDVVSDAGDVRVDGGADDERLCANACASVIACANAVRPRTYSASSCEDACKRELRAEGYLDVEVAQIGFEFLRTLRADPECWEDVGPKFGFFDPIIESDYQLLSRAALIHQCADSAMNSDCGTAARSKFLGDCFNNLAKYHPRLRAHYESCGLPTTPCRNYGLCLNEVDLPVEVHTGNPWLGESFLDWR